MEFETKVEKTMELIRERYLNKEDDREHAIAWSGGKDSTALLSLVINTLHEIPKEERTRTIQVVMSDTRVENPILESYMHSQVKLLKDYVKKWELPIKVNLVHRHVNDSYFVLTLGRGYFLPLNNGQGRWCTGRLKIKPQDIILKEINPSYIYIGTRHGESQNRSSSITKWSTSEFVGKHATLTNSQTFMPVVNWSVEDIWEYLTADVLGWTDSIPVRRLYREATGECGLQSPNAMEEKLRLAKMESCGARFGCWLCPVVETDRSTEEMSDYHGWLEPLTRYREMQQFIYGSYTPPKIEGQKRKERSEALRRQEAINEEIKRITKSGYNRKGTRMKNGQGTFTVEARKYLFGYLLDTEKAVNHLRKLEGLEPTRLIADDEIERIKELWEEDYKDYPFVITNAENIPFDNVIPLLKGEIDDTLVENYKKEWREKQDARKKRKQQRKEDSNE